MVPEVSIIFVNYHTSHLIADSIKSILKYVTDINYEIIIVDNNTEKDINQKFSSFLPAIIPIKYIYLPENIGFGRANNEGAKNASGKCLFFLNPDTLLLNNAIKILYEFLNDHPDVGACGGNLYGTDNNSAYSFKKIYPGVRWEFEELTHYLFSNPINPIKNTHNFSDKPIPVAYISGADLMVKSEIFKECGGFSADLFMYWDDVEVCKRIHYLGYKIFNVPSARICHLESKSFENFDPDNTFKFELQEKYRLIYLKRNIGRFQTVISNFLYFLFFLSRIYVLKGIKKEYYKKRKEIFQKFLKNPELEIVK